MVQTLAKSRTPVRGESLGNVEHQAKSQVSPNRSTIVLKVSLIVLSEESFCQCDYGYCGGLTESFFTLNFREIRMRQKKPRRVSRFF